MIVKTTVFIIQIQKSSQVHQVKGLVAFWWKLINVLWCTCACMWNRYSYMCISTWVYRFRKTSHFSYDCTVYLQLPRTCFFEILKGRMLIISKTIGYKIAAWAVLNCLLLQKVKSVYEIKRSSRFFPRVIGFGGQQSCGSQETWKQWSRTKQKELWKGLCLGKGKESKVRLPSKKKAYAS